MRRWVTFDCYGTLTDFEPELTDAFRRLWPGADARRVVSHYVRVQNTAERGETARDYHRIAAASLRAAAALNELPDRPEGPELVLEACRSANAFDEVPAVVAELRRRGWGIGVLTNVSADVVTPVLQRAGAEIDVLVTFAETGTYKPDPGHWRRFQELSGVAPGRHVHVGAWLHGDVLPATRLGLPCVWINRWGETSPLPRSAELPSLAGLPEVLEALMPASAGGAAPALRAL